MRCTVKGNRSLTAQGLMTLVIEKGANKPGGKFVGCSLNGDVPGREHDGVVPFRLPLVGPDLSKDF